MKKVTYINIAVLAVFIFFPVLLLGAQSKTKTSLPKVPITYPGDTDETIRRRAQWIEEAKKEGKLVWWGSKSAAVGLKLIAEFNKVYPFIEGTFRAARGEESASQIEMEHMSGKHTVDVLEGASNEYPRWRKMEIPAEFTHIIPGIKKWHKNVYSKYGDWAIAGGNVYVPQYNTNLVSKAEAPKNWEDLLDPKWKGKIGITTDIKLWISLALDEGGWGIEKTEQYLSKLKEQKLNWGQGHSAGHTLLIAGEFSIHAEGYLYHVMNSQKKGAPVDFVRVDPIVVTGPTIGRLNKAPHPNSANLFLEWLLSPQGLLIFENISGQGAVFPGAMTRQAKLVEGLNMVFRTEEGTIKAYKTGLFKKFNKVLGILQ